jgi:hypothetical protein
MLANEATLSVRSGIDILRSAPANVPEQPYNHVINAKSELPAFLIKPVQRICKSPLLLDVSLMIMNKLICH